jgi:hypothetical protein
MGRFQSTSDPKMPFVLGWVGLDIMFGFVPESKLTAKSVPRVLTSGSNPRNGRREAAREKEARR